MGHFKTFMLGMGVAFGIYYITKKDADGKSILDDILDNPSKFAETAKNYAVAEAVQVVKNNSPNIANSFSEDLLFKLDDKF